MIIVYIIFVWDKSYWWVANLLGVVISITLSLPKNIQASDFK